MADPYRPMKPCPRPDCDKGYVHEVGKSWASFHCPECHGTGRVLDQDALREMIRADAERARVVRDAERRVLEAARAWREMRAGTPTRPKPESAALIAAVDALNEVEADNGAGVEAGRVGEQQ